MEPCVKCPKSVIQFLYKYDIFGSSLFTASILLGITFNDFRNALSAEHIDVPLCKQSFLYGLSWTIDLCKTNVHNIFSRKHVHFSVLGCSKSTPSFHTLVEASGA